MAKDNLKTLNRVTALEETSENFGNLVTITVPTTDPEVDNVIWLDGTTLKVSVEPSGGVI